MMAQQQEISQSLNNDLIGKELNVLVDEKSTEEQGLFYGRTEGDAPEVDGQVIIHSRSDLKPGDFAAVRITDALEYDLIGSA